MEYTLMRPLLAAAGLTLVATVLLAAPPVRPAEPAAQPEPLFLDFLRPERHYEPPPAPTEGVRAFSITLNFTGGLTPAQEADFVTAKGRWESRLAGYVAGVSLSGITIDASASYIDGPGGILGSAGPTYYTIQAGYALTTQGAMEFDTADIPSMETNGSFDDVIEHEMGHVIGLGIWWDYNTGYVAGSGHYTGAYGLAAYRAEFIGQGGAAYVPVELGGGSGTANGHWNEVDGGAGLTGIADSSGHDMRNELMTGWLNMPTFYSNTTNQQFRDLGFVVSSGQIFANGFESGTTSAWSLTVP